MRNASSSPEFCTDFPGPDGTATRPDDDRGHGEVILNHPAARFVAADFPVASPLVIGDEEEPAVVESQSMSSYVRILRRHPFPQDTGSFVKGFLSRPPFFLFHGLNSSGLSRRAIVAFACQDRTIIQ
jgi:hypothetical protein